MAKRNLGFKRRFEDMILSRVATRLSGNKNHFKYWTTERHCSDYILCRTFLLDVGQSRGNSWTFYDYFEFVYERHVMKVAGHFLRRNEVSPKDFAGSEGSATGRHGVPATEQTPLPQTFRVYI